MLYVLHKFHSHNNTMRWVFNRQWRLHYVVLKNMNNWYSSQWIKKIKSLFLDPIVFLLQVVREMCSSYSVRNLCWWRCILTRAPRQLQKKNRHGELTLSKFCLDISDIRHVHSFFKPGQKQITLVMSNIVEPGKCNPMMWPEM